MFYKTLYDVSISSFLVLGKYTEWPIYSMAKCLSVNFPLPTVAIFSIVNCLMKNVDNDKALFSQIHSS